MKRDNQMQALNKCITFFWKLSCVCTTYRADDIPFCSHVFGWTEISVYIIWYTETESNISHSLWKRIQTYKNVESGKKINRNSVMSNF